MTPGRLWWLLKRDLQRGPAACWGDYVTAPAIWRWRNPNASKPLEAVPVVVVLGKEHLTMVAWMIASWTASTGRNWRIILHDDGTLPPDADTRLRALGLSVTVIPRAAADGRMQAHLSERPRCRDYRHRYPLGLKVFDVPSLHSVPRLLLLDPDVLFFQTPAEILRWVDDPEDESCWFNEDVAEASTVTPELARNALGVQLWPKVNSGLCLLTRSAVDLDFCERVMTETPILAGHFWRVEQTLIALSASRHNRGGLLPGRYEISLGRDAQSTAVSRHYVGRVRDRFWAEGVRKTNSLLSAGSE